jgi:hypothetical protein
MLTILSPTCAAVHLEQMSHDHWRMGLEAGGRRFQPTFGVRVGTYGFVCPTRVGRSTEWESDSRKRTVPDDHFCCFWNILGRAEEEQRQARYGTV